MISVINEKHTEFSAAPITTITSRQITRRVFSRHTRWTNDRDWFKLTCRSSTLTSKLIPTRSGFSYFNYPVRSCRLAVL